MILPYNEVKKTRHFPQYWIREKTNQYVNTRYFTSSCPATCFFLSSNVIYSNSINIFFVGKDDKNNTVHYYDGLVWFMVFNATFNNISVISWRSVLLVEKTTDLPQVTDNLYHIMLY